MHPSKKQKVITSDLNWCINNSSLLSPSIFIEIFNYGDKKSANRRYTNILNMRRFNNNVSNASQLREAFNIWKGSQQEVTFWDNRKVELARQTANARTRASVITSVGRIGAQEGLRLGGDNNNNDDNTESSSEVTDNNSTSVSVIMDEEETLITDNGGDDSGPVETESETDGRKRKKTKLNFSKFQQEFDKMIDEYKWTLRCSGRKVEDVLYMYGNTLKYEHLCHSFVVDPWDKTYLTKSVFTKAEIDEIKNWKQKGYPVPEENCLNYLNQYKKIKNATEARKKIFETQNWDIEFDRKMHHDLDWIRHNYYTMVRELERGGVGDHTNSETWLLSHIWTSVDRVFDDMDLYVLRGENASTASSRRKNKERVPQGEEKLERKKMGRRLDMILRKKKLELGGGEAGKETEDNDTKLLSERDLKLPKALKDMIMMIKEEKGDLEGVRVAGLLQYGLKMTSITLDVPEKYAHRITRTKTVLVPHTFEDLPEFRKVLYMALSNKAIVVDTLKLLSKPVQDQNEGDDYLCRVMIPPEEDIYQLPDTFGSQ